MTGRAGKGRSRKPLETTLGTASTMSAQEKADLSQVQKPINTSVFGLKQVLSLFQTATDEVQNYIAHECDVLYECRICRAIFRSLANFILHKRSYCKEKFHNLAPGNMPNTGHEDAHGGFVIDSADYFGESSDSRPMTPSSETTGKTKKVLSPIIDRLRKYQEIAEFAKETLNEDLTITKKCDQDENNDLILEKIETNGHAVFQTSSRMKEAGQKGLIKSEVMEIHDIFENNEAVLDSDGKIRNFDKPKTIFPKQDLVCTECDFKFATIKTLTHHIKTKHNKTCTIFPCPDCKETFVNAWCVYRHLYKVHRRSSAQVKRLRGQIHSGAIRKEQEPVIGKRIKKEIEDLLESENQWMANFEWDKDLQMCGGCGKKFERKAALQSHSAICTKRIAICNNLKETSKSTREKLPVKIVKGAAKRKCVSARSQPKQEDCSKIIDVDSNSRDQADNDSGDKTPTKRKPMPEKTRARTPQMQIEIFDISDESSSESAETEMAESLKKLSEFERILSKNSTEIKVKSFKRKRTQSCDFRSDGKVSKCARDKAVNAFTDETNESFVAKAAPYMKKNELKCISCQTSYSSLFLLLWHMSQHFSWYRFQCSKCTFVSFNKHDCVSHALIAHNTPQDLIESTILPIPKWKIISMAHKFKRLKSRNNPPQEEKQQFTDTINNLKIEDVETIILDGDDNDQLSEDGKSEHSMPPPACDTIILLDDEDKEDTGKKLVITKAGPSGIQAQTRSNSRRPVRVRTKSVRTFQNDFIYDLENVLKPNENSFRNRLGPPKDMYKNRKRSSEI